MRPPFFRAHSDRIFQIFLILVSSKKKIKNKNKNDRQCGVVCQVEPPTQPHVNLWCRELSARYGMRAQREWGKRLIRTRQPIECVECPTVLEPSTLNCAVGQGSVGDCDPCHGLGTTVIRSRTRIEMWFPGQMAKCPQQFPRVRRHSMKWADGYL